MSRKNTKIITCSAKLSRAHFGKRIPKDHRTSKILLAEGALKEARPLVALPATE
jgi:hypothetical protein